MTPQSAKARAQDFFEIQAPLSAVERALEQASFRPSRGSALVLNLHREDRLGSGIRLDGKSVPVVPFPYAAKSLVELALDANEYAKSEAVMSLYLLRATFDQLADRHGAKRISRLALRPGDGVNDEVMINLAACLPDRAGKTSANDAVSDQVALALNIHMAQRYGGMRVCGTPMRGGLAPWQLRLARKVLDDNLDSAAPIEAIAEKCGLSVSHFSRAFRRSTGLPPHRWLMQRRIESAKDLILRDVDPLADIALACGFSDQSHLTRAFAKATGLTPGRWRAFQMGDTSASKRGQDVVPAGLAVS
jgi:AraC-like DNA-binding protein